jgi:hypothetical protein
MPDAMPTAAAATQLRCKHGIHSSGIRVAARRSTAEQMLWSCCSSAPPHSSPQTAHSRHPSSSTLAAVCAGDEQRSCTTGRASLRALKQMPCLPAKSRHEVGCLSAVGASTEWLHISLLECMWLIQCFTAHPARTSPYILADMRRPMLLAAFAPGCTAPAPATAAQHALLHASGTPRAPPAALTCPSRSAPARRRRPRRRPGTWTGSPRTPRWWAPSPG